jgi:hypothetical protein
MNVDVEPAGDALDRLLHEAARRDSYIDDAGFTYAVLRRLPQPVNRALRQRILLGFGLLACVVGLWVFGGAAYIWQAALGFAVSREFGPAQFGVLAAALSLYGSLYAIVRDETA